MRSDQLERRLRKRLAAFGPAPRAELLHVLLPDLERAERIGEFWSHPQSRTFAVIDCRGGQGSPGGAGRLAAGG